MARKDSKAGAVAAQQSNPVDHIDKLLKTASLDGLQSEAYRTALAVLDRLRTQGLDSRIGLPQLVVCGNQSSGKSSVLEAITEVSFPRKEGLCTRFPTQIILRRAPKDSIRTRIIPDHCRSSAERVHLLKFSATIQDFSQLPNLIDQVTGHMGLHALGTSTRGSKTTAAFSRDVLSVEISGPNRPQLTLVDLPGLVLSTNKDQTEADIKLIKDLIQDYLRNDRTIMLPVISAMDDLANQGILELCKEFDPDRSRTLGIITKLDCLKDGSHKQLKYIETAQNKNVSMKLGWHMLKNWSDDDGEFSFDARNDAEQLLFRIGKYREVQETDKGIFALRTKLSDLLFNHVKREIPTVREDAVQMRAAAQRERAKLGKPILDGKTQQRTLMRLAETCRDILKDATKGTYDEHDFFRQDPVDITSVIPDDADKSESLEQQNGDEQAEDIPTPDIDVEIPVTYLRANVSKLQQNFTHQMYKYGHKYIVYPGKLTAGTQAKNQKWPELLPQYEEAHSGQKELTDRQAITWVKSRHQMTRGIEIPGTSTTALVCHIFHEQSTNWEDLAEKHISNVEAACSGLVQKLLHYLETSPPLKKSLIQRANEKLLERLEAAEAELRRIMEDHLRPVMTYDPAFATRILSKVGKSAANKSDDIAKAVANEDAAAAIALRQLFALYESKVKDFIAMVTEQVIERHLIRGLSEDVFSPSQVGEMSEEEIHKMFEEPEDLREKREKLDGQLKVLGECVEALDSAIDPQKRGRQEQPRFDANGRPSKRIARKMIV